ncbi:MAG: hypothetical protein OEZ22_13270 [Spirochaetia bacterium]|nr:hypothetical protein [Spirochaetia bacterium]
MFNNFLKLKFLALIIFLLYNCGSLKYSIKNVENMNAANKVFFAANENNLRLITYTEANDNISLSEILNINVPQIKNIIKISNDVIAMASEEKGIFFFSLSAKKIISQIPLENLADYRIRNLYYNFYKKEKTLFITYYTPTGSGVTLCTVNLKNNNTNFDCSQLNTNNSELTSDFVNEIDFDTKDNIWFRYSILAGHGVSRLSPDGKWSHYTKYNSDLGSSEIEILLCEKQSEGIAEDNIWFASENGLSRLMYKNNEEEFKFFGDKKGGASTVTKFLGIEDWFTDAIINITDLKTMPNALAISNKKAIYVFTGDNINQYSPENFGGYDKNIIGGLFYQDEYIYAKIYSTRSHPSVIKSINIFNLKEKRWNIVNLWQFEKIDPLDASIYSLDEKRVFFILKYKHEDDKIIIYNTADSSIKNLLIPTAKLNDN